MTTVLFTFVGCWVVFFVAIAIIGNCQRRNIRRVANKLDPQHRFTLPAARHSKSVDVAA
jgi:thiosulfate reductase cytochrome b subunit